MKTNSRDAWNHGASEALPTQATTKGGATFDANAKVWAYRDGADSVHLNFDFEADMTVDLQRAFRATLVWYAENHSPSHLKNTHAAMQKFVGLIKSVRAQQPIERIESTDVLSHRIAMSYAMKRLAAFFKKWHALGHPGLDDSAVSIFAEMTIKGNTVGDAVLTRDPIKGPFTDIERSGIEDALNQAYGLGKLPEHHYLLAWLFMALGARPIQFAAMKVCDVRATSNDDGHVEYSIRVPRAKQRTNIRDSFADRLLSPQIGKHVVEYAAGVREAFSSILGDPEQAPLFPSSYRRTNQKPAHRTSGWNAYHKTAEGLGAALQDALSKLDVRSERTGEALRLNPRRFRYTFGTNAAREGRGVLVIAELLDHSGIETAGAYVAASPEMTSRIERATALQLAPLAQAFKGVLIQHESEATRGTDSGSRIIDLRIDRSAKPMGSCGQHGFCGFLAPISCYTCANFEPWADGPHEKVLDYLLAEREKKVGDSRIAGINDRTILAVAQVVQLCRDKQRGEEK
jgi:integrase